MGTVSPDSSAAFCNKAVTYSISPSATAYKTVMALRRQQEQLPHLISIETTKEKYHR